MLATISSICTPSIDTFVYGSPDVSTNDNIVIFKAVQRFISKSKVLIIIKAMSLTLKLALYFNSQDKKSEKSLSFDGTGIL